MQNPADRAIAQRNVWPSQLTIGCIVGLALGCVATVDAFLLRNRVIERKTASLKSPPGTPPPLSEIADYLEGKTLPSQLIPNAGGSAGQPQATLVIHGSGIRDLRWQGSSQPEAGASEPWYHNYILLYDVGGDAYVADISIRYRQVGNQQAFLGYEVTRVERADRIATGR